MVKQQTLLLLQVFVSIQSGMRRDNDRWDGKDFIRRFQGCTDHPDKGQHHKSGDSDQQTVYYYIREQVGKSSCGHGLLLICLLSEITELQER